MLIGQLLVTLSCVSTQVLGVAVIQKFDANLKEEFLKAHNDIRGQVSNPQATNMQTMLWDDNLALVAKENVKTCVMKHTSTENRKTSEFDPVGENLFEHWGANKSLANIGQHVVAAWYSEIKDYHFGNRTCNKGKMCGHYTQVVWAMSYKVGCAIAICNGGEGGQLDGILVCCDYGPSGNQVGPDGAHSPYKVGEPCTGCYDGQRCNNQLCLTPDGVTPPPELQPVIGVQTLSEDLKDDIIKEHNGHRNQVSDPQATNMQMMSWDDELAKVAEANVEGCILKHTSLDDRRTSLFYPVGENLYTYRGSDTSLDGIANRIVTKWYTEKKDFHFNDRTCNQGKMCSHYVQLIWATSVKVGCAIAICDGKKEKQLKGIYACCNYGPAGNLYEESGLMSPYKAGEPCTGCTDGQICKDKLCYTPTTPTVAVNPSQSSTTTKTPEPTQSSTTIKMSEPNTTTKTTKSTEGSTTTKTMKPTEGSTTTKATQPTQSSTTIKVSEPHTTTKTTKSTEGSTTTKATQPTQSSTTIKVSESHTTTNMTKPTEGSTTIKFSDPKQSNTATKTPGPSQSSTIAKTPDLTQSSTTTKTSRPTEASTIAETSEPPKDTNATRKSPVSTTSGQRGVHSIQLLLVMMISCLTGWFILSQKL